MLRSTSTLSPDACATAGGNSRSPRILSRSTERAAPSDSTRSEDSTRSAPPAAAGPSRGTSVAAGGLRRDRRIRGAVRKIVAETLRQEEEVGRHERRLPAEPLGNERFGIGFAELFERSAEAFEVRAIPRLARHEIFGDEPGLGRETCREIRVRKQRLCAAHRRLESPVDADLDETHQCRNVVRHARDEFLQRRGGRGPVLPRDRRVGGELDDLQTTLGHLLGDGPSQERDGLATVRVLLEDPAHDRRAFVGTIAAQMNLGRGEQQLRIVADRLGR
jgi:hypothetical protein